MLYGLEIIMQKVQTKDAYDKLLNSMLILSMSVYGIATVLGVIFINLWVLLFAIFMIPVFLIGVFVSSTVAKNIARALKFTNNFVHRVMVGLLYSILAEIFAVFYLVVVADQNIWKEFAVLIVILVFCICIGFISARVLPSE